MTKANFVENPVYDDVVAWSSTGYCDAPIEIPYRALLAQKIDNLLAAGRHISADPLAIGAVQLIPQCVQTGQATGVAAAVAVKDGSTAHTVDIKKVQYILSHEQNVPLPRQENTDPELVRQLEEIRYGVMTESSKRVRAAGARHIIACDSRGVLYKGRTENMDPYKEELAEISSIILFAWGVDSQLIGNTPGTTTRSGGTDLRERYLLKQVNMALMQQLVLNTLQVVNVRNQWDPHLQWQIKKEVLTTLDNSKTGITTAETSE